jgi:hypothetical protein
MSLSVAVGLALAGPAEATHEVTHRYVVLGYVRDGTDRPVPGIEVRVTRENTGLVYRERTGPDGLYMVIVHLHDEDLLDRLDVRAGQAAIHIEARFDPLNVRAERATRVDFTGGRVVERHETFAPTLEEYLRR